MIFVFGECERDIERRELRRAGVVRALELKAFTVLVHLLTRRHPAVDGLPAGGRTTVRRDARWLPPSAQPPPLACPVHALQPPPVPRSGPPPLVHKTVPVRNPLVSTRRRSKTGPQDYRVLFPFCFEKNYAILSAT